MIDSRLATILTAYGVVPKNQTGAQTSAQSPHTPHTPHDTPHTQVSSAPTDPYPYRSLQVFISAI